uniref:Uncharacterized protein n=1 Tax=Romanomermis culicivorax TaxID=13658 RepID=A0A915JCH4_ROMCU
MRHFELASNNDFPGVVDGTLAPSPWTNGQTFKSYMPRRKTPLLLKRKNFLKLFMTTNQDFGKVKVYGVKNSNFAISIKHQK